MRQVCLCFYNAYSGQNYLNDTKLDADRMAVEFAKFCDKVEVQTKLTWADFKARVLGYGLVAGDILHVWNSGHGGQRKSVAEPDGYEECIIFWDGHNYEWVPGKEYAAFFKSLPCKVNIGLDNCFAGGDTRNVHAPHLKPRFIDSSTNLAGRRRVGWSLKSATNVSWGFASGELEPSMSTGNGGEYTNAVLNAIESGKRTFQEVLDFVVPLCPDQTPGFEAASDALQFPEKGIEPPAPTPARQFEVNQVASDLRRFGTALVFGMGNFERYKRKGVYKVRFNPAGDFLKAVVP